MNKNNYVIHYRNLQQCLALGMQLKKIHRILKFKQIDWMRPYIDFNTQKTTTSNNEADKSLFMLINNSLYGKAKKNLRNIIKIRAVKNSHNFIKYTSRATFVNWKVFENNLAAIHEKKISLTLSKPISVGFTVLETTKWEMYHFHYNFMISKFHTRSLFTDTGSLHYELHENNPCKKMYKSKELFDLSNFPVSRKYCFSDNKKLVGKMKHEYGGKSILKFVVLKSKM